MRCHRLPLSAVFALLVAAPGAARAQGPPSLLLHPSLFQSPPPRVVARALPLASSLGPGQQCRLAIRAAERVAGIPNQLMAAIARVESGRRDADGRVNPWPWSINAEGTDHVFETKAEAIAAVRSLQGQGVRSIDVGCMQVNLLHHPDAFPSLELAFDPVANADYAARFLVQLHEQTGTWPTATAWYHSATPALGADYQRRVMAVWPEEQQRPNDPAPPPLARAFAGAPTSLAPAVGGPSGPVRIGGAMIMAQRAEPPHLIPMALGSVGRDLSAYRAAPIQVVAPLPPVLRMPGNRG